MPTTSTGRCQPWSGNAAVASLVALVMRRIRARGRPVLALIQLAMPGIQARENPLGQAVKGIPPILGRPRRPTSHRNTGWRQPRPLCLPAPVTRAPGSLGTLVPMRESRSPPHYERSRTIGRHGPGIRSWVAHISPLVGDLQGDELVCTACKFHRHQKCITCPHASKPSRDRRTINL